MSSKDLGEAQRKAAERKKLLKQPVPMLPDAPENKFISKKEFIARRRAQKEEDLKVEAYRKSLKAEKSVEKLKEETDGKEEKRKVLRGRPKKVE